MISIPSLWINVIMLTVREVPAHGLCVGCGACAAICPADAIIMSQDIISGIFKPVIEFGACTECGKCVSVCPAVHWSNAPHLEPSHPLLGDYIQAYAAFAVNQDIRIGSASGGFVTGLLTSLLQNGHIDGAVVSRRVKSNPLQSETILARTSDELISCKGSIYSPVCFAEIYRKLSCATGKNRLAVVGLPCHIQALALMAARNKNLARQVFLTVSLVCGHTPAHLAYRYTLKRLGIAETELMNINNRGGGWPGFLRIELNDGTVKRVPYGDALSWGMVFSSPLFTPLACHVCPDPGGFAADIMVSDAWLPRYRKDRDGVNLVLAKTCQVDEIIRKVQQQGDLWLECCAVEDFIAANRNVFVAKTRNHGTAMNVLVGSDRKLFHQNIRENYPVMSMSVRLRLWFYYVHVKLAGLLRLDRLAVNLPKSFLFYWKFVGLMKR